MQGTNHTKQLEKFYETCRQHKLKITPQRTSVYRAVMHAKNHPSADDIFQIVKREYPNISFDTVNRTLITFTQIGLITVAESYRGARRFDPNFEDHHHMHCLKCGSIVDFISDEFNQLMAPKQLMRKFATVLSSRVIINGICLDCHNKE
jgi:Fur family peroxide stress response transcriptional regulator